MVEGAVRESAKDREAGQVQNSGSMLSWQRERNGGGAGGARHKPQTRAFLWAEDGQYRASYSAAAARGSDSQEFTWL